MRLYGSTSTSQWRQLKGRPVLGDNNFKVIRDAIHSRSGVKITMRKARFAGLLAIGAPECFGPLIVHGKHVGLEPTNFKSGDSAFFKLGHCGSKQASTHSDLGTNRDRGPIRNRLSRVALGQTLQGVCRETGPEFRFGSKAGLIPTADSRSANQPYSITSSAIASRDGGMSMPSALAAFKLMVSSNLVGCSTGRSAGTAPLKILST